MPVYSFTQAVQRSGVINGARMVDTAVMPTDSATSPPAIKVMTLEEVPPGQHPTRMTPTASSAGRLNNLHKTSPARGMIRY